MVDLDDNFCIGDLVIQIKSPNCIGVITEVSNAWTPSASPHHVKVFFNTIFMWVPVEELKVLSRAERPLTKPKL